jgi:hypothetical protein
VNLLRGNGLGSDGQRLTPTLHPAFGVAPVALCLDRDTSQCDRVFRSGSHDVQRAHVPSFFSGLLSGPPCLDCFRILRRAQAHARPGRAVEIPEAVAGCWGPDRSRYNRSMDWPIGVREFGAACTGETATPTTTDIAPSSACIASKTALRPPWRKGCQKFRGPSVSALARWKSPDGLGSRRQSRPRC